MEPMGIIYAIFTVLAWGTWLAPSQKVDLPNSQARALYIALGNLILAAVALVVVGVNKLSGQIFLLPFLGGLIWAVSGICAFVATKHIGMAKAFGTWAPLNIIVAIIWGIVLFDSDKAQFMQPKAVLLVGVIIGGILMIIFSGGTGSKEQGKNPLLGYAGALGAGILWGTYWIPSSYLSQRVENVSDWVTAFPLAVGMFVGSAILVALSRKAPKCKNPVDYARVLSSGALWSIGNFSMLLMASKIGMGKGGTIAQLCVVVNAVVGILIFKDPPPKSKAAAMTFVGVVIAMIGAIALANIKGS
ncbi:GRP family sugar transporter [Planctomycetota bacterium]